jgi:hypothetical protein
MYGVMAVAHSLGRYACMYVCMYMSLPYAWPCINNRNRYLINGYHYLATVRVTPTIDVHYNAPHHGHSVADALAGRLKQHIKHMIEQRAQARRLGRDGGHGVDTLRLDEIINTYTSTLSAPDRTIMNALGCIPTPDYVPSYVGRPLNGLSSYYTFKMQYRPDAILAYRDATTDVIGTRYYTNDDDANDNDNRDDDDEYDPHAPASLSSQTTNKRKKRRIPKPNDSGDDDDYEVQWEQLPVNIDVTTRAGRQVQPPAPYEPIIEAKTPRVPSSSSSEHKRQPAPLTLFRDEYEEDAAARAALRAQYKRGPPAPPPTRRSTREPQPSARIREQKAAATTTAAAAAKHTYDTRKKR